MSIHKLAIIGSGQIGTSLAMATASAHPEIEIIAYDARAIEKPFLEALHMAGVTNGKIRFTIDPSDVRQADLVVLATPVSLFSEAIKDISPFVDKNTIFTDVGSVKELSQERIRTALNRFISPETPYVPFHILNGNAGTGPSTAGKTVFHAPGALVPGCAAQEIENKVEAFWQSIGTTIHRMSANTHDMIFGTTSHL